MKENEIIIQKETTPTTWRRYPIYVPDKEDVEVRIGKQLSNKEYNELIDYLFDHITYDDYKDQFLDMVQGSYEDMKVIPSN